MGVLINGALPFGDYLDAPDSRKLPGLNALRLARALFRILHGHLEEYLDLQKCPKYWTLYCLCSLFLDIGPLFWALLEVQVAATFCIVVNAEASSTA